ncbi:Methyltransferase-like protein 25 [Microtus ochrogaster]|uniref:Methyltransferase-like protein 25 n=1 Tax=Microtus ochrogaster TaxID=79684 RepID=A0A8J6GN60_MICOH|nr:Methyltransferase-like protein 25 [Microtus ochrogaster]
MAALGSLPATPDLPTLHARLQDLLRFLRGALAISSAHTVDFYTESVWRELVDLPPESVLAALRGPAAEPEPEPREEEAGPGDSRGGGAGGDGAGRMDSAPPPCAPWWNSADVAGTCVASRET